MDKERLKELLISLKDTIDKATEELDTVEKQEDTPKIGDHYFFLFSTGDIQQATWDNNDSDHGRYAIGNFYRTFEEAYAYKDYLIIHQKLRKLASSLNILDKDKTYCLYCYGDKIEQSVYNCHFYLPNSFANTITCTDLEFRSKAIEVIGEENLIRYLKYNKQ